MLSYFGPFKNSFKNSFGKVVFQILAKIEMTRNKIRLFGRHFEMVQHFQFFFFFCFCFCFFAELWFFIVNAYMVQILLQKSGGKSGFLEGVPWTPLEHQREQKYLGHLVKRHLEPTHLKSSPLFTFSTKLLSQDSPSIHLFSKVIGSRFTTAKDKVGWRFTKLICFF